MIRENNPVNHKKSELVLRVFKRIFENLLEEAAVLNTYAEFHNQVQFQIAHLDTDEGTEFKGTFRQFLDKKNIRKHVFKKSEGSNQQLAIMETFNRTTRCTLDIQRHQYFTIYWNTSLSSCMMNTIQKAILILIAILIQIQITNILTLMGLLSDPWVLLFNILIII